MKIDPQKIQKVAVLGLSCLGDMLLASAALWNLRRFLPEARFVLWVGPVSRVVVDGDPLWDEVRTYDRSKEYKGLAGRLKIIRELRKEGFDLVIDLRSSLLPIFSGCRYKPLWGAREVLLPKRMHEAERNIYAMSTLGVPVFSRQLRFYIPERDRLEALRTLRERAAKRMFVMMNPGSRNPKKRLPHRLCVELGKRLIKEHSAVVGLMGYAPEEEAAARAIAAELETDVVDLSGKQRLSLTAAFMEQAKLFVTGDTAALHVASALGTPTVGVYGPSRPDRYGPWGNRHRVVLAPFDCAPCNDKGCVKGEVFRCLEHVKPDSVYETCMELLIQVNHKGDLR
ncbi:MAG TPA: glycosyltransferase family 9 protein [Synergistaceae bacterium]|jgi:heptosyltransferase-2|nr:MAG: Glycosyl transferase family 9 [Synergistales bacterium 53_16]HAA47243.1 glycosyltransferase family 9 protein [Synergistaceae bacterium]